MSSAVPEEARTKVAAEFPTHHRSCAAAGADGTSLPPSRTTSFTHGPDTVFTSTWTTHVAREVGQLQQGLDQEVPAGLLRVCKSTHTDM